ncbi:MAG: hypothetical protein ABI883_00315 [Chthoniobacterales bacterium]
MAWHKLAEKLTTRRDAANRWPLRVSAFDDFHLPAAVTRALTNDRRSGASLGLIIMKTNKIIAIQLLLLPLFWMSSVFASDGFDSVRCGSDVRKALLGRKTSNEKVVVLEARHKDLGLEDLGAEEISDRLNLIYWRICGEEYAVLEDGNVIRDVLKFPKHSKDMPQFIGTCQSDGHDLPGFAIGVLRNEEGVAMLGAVSAWKIDEKQEKFVELKTEGLRCSRDGIRTEDSGR